MLGGVLGYLGFAFRGAGAGRELGVELIGADLSGGGHFLVLLYIVKFQS